MRGQGFKGAIDEPGPVAANTSNMLRARMARIISVIPFLLLGLAGAALAAGDDDDNNPDGPAAESPAPPPAGQPAPRGRKAPSIGVEEPAPPARKGQSIGADEPAPPAPSLTSPATDEQPAPPVRKAISPAADEPASDMKLQDNPP